MKNAPLNKKLSVNAKSKLKPGIKTATKSKKQEAKQKVKTYQIRKIVSRKQAEEAPRKSETQFSALIEQAPLAINITRGTNIIYANPSYLEMFGYSNFDELKILSPLELFTPESRPQILENIQRRSKDLPVPDHYEAECIRKGGMRFPVLIYLTRTVFAEGPATVAFVLDITEGKQAEDKLRISEKRFSTAFEYAAIGMALVAIDGRWLRVNRALCELLGYTSEELLAKTFQDITYPDDVEADLAYVQKMLEGEIQTYQVEKRYFHKSGQIVWVLLNVSLIRDDQGEPIYFIFQIENITERKHAEKALVNERNLLRTLIDNLPDAIYAKDLEGHFMLKNTIDARKMGASSPEETLGKTDFDYYSPDLAAQYTLDDQAVLQSGQPILNKEERIVDATGRSGWVSTTKVPLRDPQGKVIGLVGIGHDITRSKQTEEQVHRQLQRLAALRANDQVVTSTFDLSYNLKWILESMTKELGVDAADILILNNAYQSLNFTAGVGFRERAVEKTKVRLGQDYAGRVALERQMIQIPNLEDKPNDFLLKTVLASEDFKCYFGVPLVIKGNIKGVLEVYHRSPLEPNQEWFDFLNTIGSQAALAIDNASLFENLERSNIDLTLAYDATIEGWSHAMDLRDKETEGHTLRVTEMTMELAGLFGIKDEELVVVRRGALLHDIGKMGVPDSILLKPEKLTDEEWILMRKHPTFAFEMLSPIRYLQSAIDIPYCHHEKWDGTGYPRGLKGEQISLSARIFAIADVWDAVTSDRPYRKAWSKEKAIEYLKSEAGKHFDPQVVKVCFEAGVFEHKYRKPV